MQSEASGVISVNGFLHLHEYFYTDRGQDTTGIISVVCDHYSSSTI